MPAPSPQHISLASDLQSRDGTLTYDALITNGYVEKVGDNARVYKRSGLTHLINIGGVSAHGITNYIDSNGNEQLLTLFDNSFYVPVTQVPTAASADTWTTKGGPNANNYYQTIFEFNGKLWALVRNGTSGLTTDLYYKNAVSDTSWTLKASSVMSSVVPPSPVINLNGTLYIVLAGTGVNGATVWRSYDAITWTQITSTGAVSGSTDVEYAVLGNKMYAATRNNNSTGTNAVWSSSDGITWTATTTNPGWEATNDLLYFRMAAASGRLWVCGGYGNTAGAVRNKVWYSTDGITWTQATATAPFTARAKGTLLVLNNTLLMYIGGQTNIGTPAYAQDVWTSLDGATWTQQQTTTLGTSFFTYSSTIESNQGFQLSDGTIVIGYPSTAAGFPQYGYVTPTGQASIAVSSTVAIAPTGFADFATDYTRSQVMIRCDLAAYKFAPTGNTLTQITDVDYPAKTVRGCQYLDGTFYVMDANGTIYGSDIDNSASWNALNFVSAEANPDQGMYLGKSLKYIIALKSQSCQYFWDAANATGSPLSPVDNGVVLIGCAHSFSAQTLENTTIFMAQRKAQGTSFQKGRFIAIMSDQLGYEVVSTPDVDRVLNADDLATVYSCVSAENGHNFYHLYLGTSGVTLTYDMTTKLWSVWTRSTVGSSKSVSALTQSLGTATATSTAHGFSDGDEVTIAGASPLGYNGVVNITYVDANTFTYPVSSSLTTPATGTITAVGSTEAQFDMVASCSYQGTQVFQDLTTGYIWQMLDSNVQDNSVSINFKCRTAKRDYGNIYWKFAYMLTYMGNVPNVAADTGLLRYSDDDYVTYSNYRHFDLTDVYCNQRRFGKYRRRAWEWRHTAAQKHYIDFLQEDVAQGSV